jgi:hypothetical protein
MLGLHAPLKVFVATAPCDLRASFNGLWPQVTMARRIAIDQECFGTANSLRASGVLRLRYCQKGTGPLKSDPRVPGLLDQLLPLCFT